MSSYNPGRPSTERDVLLSLNGSPLFLGALVSGATTTPVNNATTATPFNLPLATAISGAQAQNKPSLAGRVLLLQPIATGLFLPSSTVGLNIVQQATAPSFVAPFAFPGILVTAGERVVWTMPSDAPYLQWLSTSGSATCLVWELS